MFIFKRFYFIFVTGLATFQLPRGILEEAAIAIHIMLPPPVQIWLGNDTWFLSIFWNGHSLLLWSSFMGTFGSSYCLLAALVGHIGAALMCPFLFKASGLLLHTCKTVCLLTLIKNYCKINHSNAEMEQIFSVTFNQSCLSQKDAIPYQNG